MFLKWAGKFLIFGSITIGVVLLFLLGLGSYRHTPGGPTKISLVAKPESSGTTGFALALPSFAEPLTTSQNATQKLAAQVAQELVRLNPNGPTLPTGAKGATVPDAEKLVNEFLTQGIKDFDYEKLKPTINDADVRIVETEDPIILAQYIKSFFTILSRVPQSLDDPDAGSIDILASVYDGYIRDYSALQVPRVLLSIHKKNLISLVATKRTLAIVRNYQADPLQAVLAFKALNNLRADMQTLYTEVALFIAEHQLTINL